MLRANRNKFDPILQFHDRAATLAMNGAFCLRIHSLYTGTWPRSRPVKSLLVSGSILHGHLVFARSSASYGGKQMLVRSRQVVVVPNSSNQLPVFPYFLLQGTPWTRLNYLCLEELGPAIRTSTKRNLFETFSSQRILSKHAALRFVEHLPLCCTGVRFSTTDFTCLEAVSGELSGFFIMVLRLQC